MTDPSAGAGARPAGFLRALFTERDNVTWDLKRVIWAIGGLLFLIRAVTVLHWDGMAFALQFSTILGAGGGVLALNRKNENGGEA